MQSDAPITQHNLLPVQLHIGVGHDPVVETVLGRPL